MIGLAQKMAARTKTVPNCKAAMTYMDILLTAGVGMPQLHGINPANPVGVPAWRLGAPLLLNTRNSAVLAALLHPCRNDGGVEQLRH